MGCGSILETVVVAWGWKLTLPITFTIVRNRAISVIVIIEVDHGIVSLLRRAHPLQVSSRD